jgi:hypothetical protein
MLHWAPAEFKEIVGRKARKRRRQAVGRRTEDKEREHNWRPGAGAGRVVEFGGHHSGRHAELEAEISKAYPEFTLHRVVGRRPG